MFENIALSFQGIWGHKMRSFLTMLGIIIGIASIITIVSTIKGTNEQIKQNLVGSGNNVVNVQLKRSEGGMIEFDWEPIPETVKVIEEETRAELDLLDGVKEVSLYRSRSWCDGVYYGNVGFNGGLVGVDGHYLSVNGYSIINGRGFVESDFTNLRKNAVLNEKAANALFAGENPVGKTLEIQGEPFTVVGVAVAGSGSGPTIKNVQDYYMYADTTAGTIMIPTNTWPVIYKYDEPQFAAVRATSTDDMTKAGRAVAEYLTKEQCTDQNYSYEANDLMEQATSLQQLSETTNAQLIWIAGISLLVGGIGVMNIMLVSVTERTREIGLKKALGARRKRILAQFLTEAAVLTSLGGILGVLAGIGFAFLMSKIMGIPVGISVPACLIAFVFSMVIGIIFGLVPALKASKLNPIEALRYE